MAKHHRAQVILNYRDVALAIVKSQNIHEGHWRVALTFGDIAGVNANIAGRLVPAAFLPVTSISLIQDDEPNDLTVDASVENPVSRILTVN